MKLKCHLDHNSKRLCQYCLNNKLKKKEPPKKKGVRKLNSREIDIWSLREVQKGLFR